jgi:hypothetical protein
MVYLLGGGLGLSSGWGTGLLGGRESVVAEVEIWGDHFLVAWGEGVAGKKTTVGEVRGVPPSSFLAPSSLPLLALPWRPPPLASRPEFRGDIIFAFRGDSPRVPSGRDRGLPRGLYFGEVAVERWAGGTVRAAPDPPSSPPPPSPSLPPSPPLSLPPTADTQVPNGGVFVPGVRSPVGVEFPEPERVKFNFPRVERTSFGDSDLTSELLKAGIISGIREGRAE